VAIQAVLLIATALAGLTGPAWAGDRRFVSSVLGGLLLVAGAALAIRGAADLREGLTPFPRPRDGAPLVQRGAYRLVRHPIYSGIILGAIGWALLSGSLAALAGAVALLLLFDLKSRREEAWLAERHPGYEQYRRRVRKLIPGIY